MKKIITPLVFLILIISSFAHEYILLAHKYKVSKGDNLELHLFAADGFNIELERPMQKPITQKMELITANGVADLLATTSFGTLPIVSRKVDFEGLGLVHIERDYAKNTMITSKFLEYLKEDHIENIKVKPDTLKKTQIERYTRYIKCLVQSGKLQNDTLYKTITGQQFEIVLLQNPYLLKKGNDLQVQIFFMGKPLPNKIITARNRTGSEPAIAINAKTNKYGICYIKLQRKGDWFIHATYMIPCADKADADWESFWTSYSFGIE